MRGKAIYSVVLLLVAVVAFTAGSVKKNEQKRSTGLPLYFVDSMHPAYRSDKPGRAPDCGMELTPVYAEDLGRGMSSTEGAAPEGVYIDPKTQGLYGIKVEKALTMPGEDTLRLFGQVTVDDTKVYRVNFGTDGFVKETHSDAMGTRVRRNQRLATVYSPEFLPLAGGFLSANERSGGGATGSMRESAGTSQNAASAQARADRLRNLGMSDLQIQDLRENRTVPEDVYVVSPSDGIIVGRNISAGSRFERHTDLYSIADLSHVWILAQVSTQDAQALRPGMVVQVKLPDASAALKARVSNVLPAVDEATHVLTVRLEVQNPGLRLRPNMWVNVEVPVRHSSSVTVPLDAVLDSGLSKRVFVQGAPGYFESREIRTGWRTEHRVQVVHGLSEGEMVVADGTFLVDSENRIQQPERLKDGHKLAAIEPGALSHPSGSNQR